MDNSYPLMDDGTRADYRKGGEPGYGAPPLSQPQVILVPQGDRSSAAGIRDFFAWSLFNLIYFNVCCMGLVATIFSVKSRDRKYLNDLQGATEYGRKAKIFNIICLILGIILTITIIGIYARMFIHLSQQVHRDQDSING
ncbi:dispanin subfamily A member 2b-like [Lethenteron reissneri]|uniref:dispanin subfamily A member 2b-like n=1 Tax=Lethenteron reissneri TaxID=7753 RepID=UPI002AB6EAB2|nr:dispanin subfamily A member 2b-like [Lethenteron reissneri]